MPMLMSRTWICQKLKHDISFLTGPSRRKSAAIYDVKGVGRPRKLLVDVGEFKGAISEWEKAVDQISRFVSTLRKDSPWHVLIRSLNRREIHSQDDGERKPVSHSDRPVACQ